MSKKISKETQDQICDLYTKQKLTFKQISEKVGYCQAACFNTVKRRGIKTRSCKKLSKEQEFQMCSEYKSGLASTELSVKYKISDSVVRDYLKRNKIQIRDFEEAHRKYEFNKSFFEDIYTQNFLWFFGWMISDGCNNTKLSRIQVTAHIQDVDVLNKMNKITESSRALDFPKNKNCVVWYLSSKSISKRMVELGCVAAKSLIVEYPSWIKEDIHHAYFLRGVFEGDGHVSLRHKNSLNVQIASASIEFLKSIESVLKKNGISSKICFSKSRLKPNSHKIYINKNTQNCLKFLKFIYQNSSKQNRMDRKYKKYIDFNAKFAFSV